MSFRPTHLAYAIGNGTSRVSIDLANLQKSGMVYGCNALYREFAPDVLVATDQGISKEIEETGYPSKNTFYTRRPNADIGSNEIPVQWRGWSSGPVSVALALNAGHHIVYLLGHDFGGTTAEFNNCYAGTSNYRDIGSAPTYAGNWVKQIATLLKAFQNSKLIRVIGKSSASSPSLLQIDNYSEIGIEKFAKTVTLRKSNGT